LESNRAVLCVCIEAKQPHEEFSLTHRQSFQMVKVGAVAAVTDDQALQDDAFLSEDALLILTPAAEDIGMYADRHARGPVSVGACREEMVVQAKV
jgi:hypothetical protein